MEEHYLAKNKDIKDTIFRFVYTLNSHVFQLKLMMNRSMLKFWRAS